MIRRLIAFVCSLMFPFLYIHGQTIGNANFLQLDKSLMKWNGFSLSQPWAKTKAECGLVKIEALVPPYLGFFCGEITDTGKSYLFTNGLYSQFAGTQFDRTILHVKGSTTSMFNCSQLSFIKWLPDSTTGRKTYQALLIRLEILYGGAHTLHLEKAKMADTAADGNLEGKEFLNERDPFSDEEITTWDGGSNFSMSLHFMREGNLIILTFDEYLTTCCTDPLNSWTN